MGRKPNQWARVEEADEIVKKLVEKNPSVLWAVRPESVSVWGIENKERSKKNDTLAQIKPVKGVEKAIFQNSNIATRYIISLYWSDWREWGPKLRKAILFHELLHIHPDYEKTVKHDCEDFRIMLAQEKLGVDWCSKSEDQLPDLTEDTVQFNLNLRPKIEDYDPEENDEITDDEDDKPSKKPSKKKAKDEELEEIEKEDDEIDEEKDEKDGEEEE